MRVLLLAVAVAFTPILATAVSLHSINDQISGFLAAQELFGAPLSPLRKTDVKPGKPVKPGTDLRILCVGDSITVGFLSERDGGDGTGYRLRLREDLSKDKVVFTGNVTTRGAMADNYFAAWNGKTIQYITDHIEPSLKQRPNIILLHAGTNDMNPNPAISTEGHDPVAATLRLGQLIDKIIQECPDAVILVAMIVGTCNAKQAPQTQTFQSLVPQVVAPRLAAGAHVLAVNLTTFPIRELQDCIHPTNNGYQMLGDYWYDFITQIPEDWIVASVGSPPDRSEADRVSGVDGFILFSWVASILYQLL
ncbi:hypothetical protein PT974_01207 [Cladobotryum mycophilum]|uniref:SGNH hydrolase-type esterase domain-containing protein n=1 Tax=Cladobotryum mycophilum TaxID=491253 RepID=A0ABR0T3M0_9HYPO